jgi:hypothetical protein
MGEEELPGGARPSHPHTLRGRLPPTLTPGRSPRARTSHHVASRRYRPPACRVALHVHPPLSLTLASGAWTPGPARLDAHHEARVDVARVRPGKLTTSPQRSPRGARRRGPTASLGSSSSHPQRSPRGARPSWPHVRPGRSPQSRARWRAASAPFARALVRGIGALHAARWRAVSAPFTRPLVRG